MDFNRALGIDTNQTEKNRQFRGCNQQKTKINDRL